MFGGVEGEGQGPKAVGVAVAGALAGETNVAGGGGFLADAAKVGADGFVAGDANGFILESGADGISQFVFDGGCKMNSFDAIFAEFPLGALGELTANAGLIDATASHAGIFEDGVKYGFLGVKGLAIQHVDGAGEIDVAELFQDPNNGEIVIAANIDSDEPGPGGGGRGGVAHDSPT